jgi:hypothetical protein
MSSKQERAGAFDLRTGLALTSLFLMPPAHLDANQMRDVGKSTRKTSLSLPKISFTRKANRASSMTTMTVHAKPVGSNRSVDRRARSAGGLERVASL